MILQVTSSLKYSFNFDLILDGYIPLKLYVIKLKLMFSNMRSLKLLLVSNYVVLIGNWTTKIFSVIF